MLIDLTMLREAYELREIDDVVWIPSEDNPADALTKDSPTLALKRWMSTNRLSVNAKSWVERGTIEIANSQANVKSDDH